MRQTPLVCAVGVLLVTTCLVLPGCGGGGSWLFSMDDEVKLGRESGDEFEKTNPLSHDATMTNLVRTIGADLARVASPPNYPYDYRLIDQDVVNAVAFPGGRMYMYRGLVEKLGGNRDMIAWVLAHETTHVAFRHAAKRIENQIGVETLAAVLLGQGNAAKIAGAVTELMFLDYGRDKEYQADHQGLIYAQKAGYDPTAAIGVIKVFQSLHSGSDPNKLELLFATHPGDDSRLNAIKALCSKYGYRGRYYP